MSFERKVVYLYTKIFNRFRKINFEASKRMVKFWSEALSLLFGNIIKAEDF